LKNSFSLSISFLLLDFSLAASMKMVIEKAYSKTLLIIYHTKAHEEENTME
jgi:hypothetical protein